MNGFIIVVTLFAISCYGSLSKVINLTKDTRIVSEHGSIPRAGRVFMTDGLAAIMGALLGTTTVTTFIESGVGIETGGRTGITALVVGVLMAAGLFLAPFIQFVPLIAMSSALVYVGVLLIPRKELLREYRTRDVWIVLAMLGITVVTLSPTWAIAVGGAGYALDALFKVKPVDVEGEINGE